MRGDTLRTDAFWTAWSEWLDYRRQAGKPLTPSTIEAQIKTLEDFGHDGAIASIEQSIRHGWAGLFEPRGSGDGGRRSRIAAKPGKYRSVQTRVADNRQAVGAIPAPGARPNSASDAETP